MTEGDEAVWDGDAAVALPDSVEGVRAGDDRVQVEVGAGTYRFLVE